jgi:hypothetical protein
LSISRPTSAYPLAFPKAFASWSIPPICCLRLAPTQFPESKQRVTSFRITVIKSLGRCFLPGLMGVHTGRKRKRKRLPLSFAVRLSFRPELTPKGSCRSPHGGSVVEVQTSPSVPEYRYPFRMNELHTIELSRRRLPPVLTDTLIRRLQRFVYAQHGRELMG